MPAASKDVLTKEEASDDEEEEEPLPENLKRFELELEFVECLASPAYLHHLATTSVLAEPSFLRFLEYLRYWKQPEYSQYLSYPHCLYFLDLLIESRAFRRELSSVGFRNFVHEQQFYSWQYRSRTLYGEGILHAAAEETQATNEAGKS
jgi:mediator of RNA polymerase II transcription subunit 31